MDKIIRHSDVENGISTMNQSDLKDLGDVISSLIIIIRPLEPLSKRKFITMSQNESS